MQALQKQWQDWHPGVPLHMLRTEYASVVAPIVNYIDDLRRVPDKQIVVLIPIVIPTKLRYSLLHNHLDVVLSRALRSQPDVVVARVGMRIDTVKPPGASAQDRLAPSNGINLDPPYAGS